MATKKKALTAPAARGRVPGTRDECASAIAQLGALQRNLDAYAGAMSSRMAEVTQDCQPAIDALKADMEALRAGVQTWCEAHRAELLDGEKKSANLITGEVGWRARPPSVVIRGLDAVIEALKGSRRLKQLLRVRQEVNKEAVLAAPELVKDIAGITVQTGVEDFYVRPFEHTA